jgi:glycine cleavage system aminomethyltransferase T
MTNTFWLCLADSDAHLYAMGLAQGRGLNVSVSLPEAYPVQVQGPKAKDLMRELAGEAILGVKYYWTLDAAIAGIPVVISRTGWTGEIGYEVFLTDPARGDELWETIMEAGAPYRIRPIAPCEARRIEAGIFNYNSDFTLDNNPFEVTGLERLVEAQEADYVGKAALERIREQGVTRKLVGIEACGDPSFFEITEALPPWPAGNGWVMSPIWSGRRAWSATSVMSRCQPRWPALATTWRSSGATVNELPPRPPRSPSSTRTRTCQRPSPPLPRQSAHARTPGP